MHAAVAETDAAFLADSRSDAGTTAVLAVACGARILIASIGDSYAIMCGRKPAIRKATGHQETPDDAVQTRRHHRGQGANLDTVSDVLSAVHSPGRPDEERRIVAAGGFVRTTAGTSTTPSCCCSSICLKSAVKLGTIRRLCLVRRGFCEWSTRCCLSSADGRARLQGELMVSRSIGDRPYRGVGLISEPELHWHNLQPGAML